MAGNSAKKNRAAWVSSKKTTVTGPLKRPYHNQSPARDQSRRPMFY